MFLPDLLALFDVVLEVVAEVADLVVDVPLSAVLQMDRSETKLFVIYLIKLRHKCTVDDRKIFLINH